MLYLPKKGLEPFRGHYFSIQSSDMLNVKEMNIGDFVIGYKHTHIKHLNGLSYSFDLTITVLVKLGRKNATFEQYRVGQNNSFNTFTINKNTGKISFAHDIADIITLMEADYNYAKENHYSNSKEILDLNDKAKVDFYEKLKTDHYINVIHQYMFLKNKYNKIIPNQENIEYGLGWSDDGFDSFNAHSSFYLYRPIAESASNNEGESALPLGFS